MISKWRNYFKRNPFQIKEINHNSEPQSFCFVDLFYRKLDVLVVRSFLNKDEVEMIKNDISGIENEMFTWHEKRYKSIPPVFEELKRYDNADEYFKLCFDKRAVLAKRMSISLEDKVIEWYSDNFSREGYEISSVKLNSTVKHFFSTGSYRIIPPSYGEIKIHADNNFYPSSSNLFKGFSEQVDLSNHVSCILTIQKAKAGGNLVLYDIDYSKYDTLSTDGMSVVCRFSGDEKKISKFKATEIEVNEGDLVLFSGGQIWHSVNKMYGEKDRITYGGFSALSKDRKKIYLWT